MPVKSLRQLLTGEDIIQLLIRVGLLGLLIIWTFLIIRPFVPILAWSAVLAVAFYPAFSWVAKILGGASADRIGAKASARRTSLVLTATGLAWVLAPGSIATYAIAAVFAGTVSSLGPVANILAVERFGQNGMALGMYRSVQIALGATASAVVGVVAGAVGLRPTLAVATLVPLALLWICRGD